VLILLVNGNARWSTFGTNIYGGIWFDANKNLNIEALSGDVAWHHVILNEAGGINIKPAVPAVGQRYGSG
jgi:hypothetical protein